MDRSAFPISQLIQRGIHVAWPVLVFQLAMVTLLLMSLINASRIN